MKIELEEPFKSLWRNGYLVVNSENRRNVCLVNDKFDRTTISYARYLMCVKIGYILSDEYEVDHINDDKTDDRIVNLQILTKAQNREKENLRYLTYEQVSHGYHCAYCKLPFIITERLKNMRIKQSTTGLAFCSKECSVHANELRHLVDD